jgi:outer membrane protein TolC
MRQPLPRALITALLTAAAGCASDSMPTERAGEAFVPRVVFEQASATSPAQTSSIRVVTSEDGWQPAVSATSEQSGQYELVAGQAPPAPLPAEAAAAQPHPALLPGTAASVDARPIDLGSALALVAGQNPQVNFARARARESYAAIDSAESIWLPNLQAGANYHHHDGQLQDVGGRAINVNRTSLNGGFGAGAVGAGTVPRPGLVLNFHLADAVLGPEIARRTAWASRHALDATINDQLLSVALAYLDLLEAHQRLAIARGTLSNTDELTEITAKFAESGQGLRADANRAETENALRRNEVLQAEESVAVASARLAELVRFDASMTLQPCEPTVVPLQLADASADARSLVATALSHRPELREQRALVDAACQRLQREKYAPLVPSILLGASYTGFGGGIGADISDVGDRTDFDALALWQVRGLGFGERAARAEASSRVDQARFRQLQTMDRVAREVVEAKAQADSRAQQILVAEDAVRAAESSYRLNSQRISELQGLPIETLQAIQALDAAQREYLRAVTDYNEAQFRLHRALGWPIGT